MAAVTLARCLPAEGAADMPWLLAGAKTLSYAVNMAALRHAERQGAGDVIFVSSEGNVLEGPRSTVVIATEIDGGLGLLTPPPWYPILRGTTQQALFEVARNKGYDCDYRALRPADLFAAQGVWLVSSITLAARVHTLDGKPLPPSPLAAEIERAGRCRHRLRSLRAVSPLRAPAGNHEKRQSRDAKFVFVDELDSTREVTRVVQVERTPGDPGAKERVALAQPATLPRPLPRHRSEHLRPAAVSPPASEHSVAEHVDAQQINRVGPRCTVC